MNYLYWLYKSEHVSSKTFRHHLFPPSQYCYDSPVLICRLIGSRLSWPEHVYTSPVVQLAQGQPANNRQAAATQPRTLDLQVTNQAPCSHGHRPPWHKQYKMNAKSVANVLSSQHGKLHASILQPRYYAHVGSQAK